MQNHGDTSLITAVAIALVYFLPTLTAELRKNPRKAGILALNLFLGWTLIGWIVAFVWACANVPATAAADDRACPHCAETVKRAARVCRHCGRDILAA